MPRVIEPAAVTATPGIAATTPRFSWVVAPTSAAPAAACFGTPSGGP